MKKRIFCFVLSLLMIVPILLSCNGTQTTDDTTVIQETDPATAEATNAQETAEPAETDVLPDDPNKVYSLTSEIKLSELKDQTVKEKVVYEYNGTSDSTSAFGLHRGAVADGTNVKFPKGEVAGVYPVSPASGDVITEYSFNVNSKQSDPTYGWFTCYFGLRLESEQADPTAHVGVWIAMRNSQIGLRKGVWPNTNYMKVDYDFTSGGLITLIDDPNENVIKIFAGDDQKEIAELKIDGNNIAMYRPGEDKAVITDITDREVFKGGYSHLWSHILDNDATVTSFKVSSEREILIKGESGIKTASRDVFSDTWTACDDLGRTVSNGTTDPNGKKVGMFYFLWHEASNNKKPLFDHTAAYEKGGIDELWNTMQSGDLGFVHYWAEPYFGYYASDDEWVIRKHAAMLTEAGVDFVFFDTTNGPLYPTSYNAVMKVWSRMRKEGNKTPDVCFLVSGTNKSELASLWGNLYSVGLYEDLWFRWNGKPLIMFTSRDQKLSDEQKKFFTVKYSWANESDPWYNDYKGIDCWAWGTMYPQKGGKIRVENVTTLEQMVVMCGFWVNGSYGTNAGRSYTQKTGEPFTLSEGEWDMGFGLYPQTSGLGLAYQEQFDRALTKSPPLIMITGWNEWWAGRWEGDAAGQTVAAQYVVSRDRTKKEYNYYVDNLDPEYSRDIEPMKGGFSDNYFYQTVDNVRKYKGSRPVEAAFGQKPINIEGSIGQWLSVGPEFRDVYGDTAERNHLSHVGGFTYTNNTGRNDIITAKVSSDKEYLYFYVECDEDITAPEGLNWMNLFIKSDGKDENGWEGFDYIVNRSQTGGKASVERFKDGWSFEKVGEAEYRLDGKTLQIKLERALIGYDGKSLDFKWADNSVDDGDIMGFLDKGDAAPDGRFCYHYTKEQGTSYIPGCLTFDMVVLKENGYNAYVDGKQIRLIEGNTKATLIASGTEFYLPAQFLESIGINCKEEKTYDHYGVAYVRADGIVKAAGKKVTVTSDGLLIIADREITDVETLDTLYRSLY